MLSLMKSPIESQASTLPHSSLEFALDLAPHVAFGDLLTAVATLLAAGQGQLHLRARVLEVDPGRDQGQAPLRGLADQALDLRPVQEQLARPLRLVVLAAGRLIRGGGELAQPDLAVVDDRVGVSHLRFPVAQRLDLGAAQDDPRLELLDQHEFVAGAPVGGDVAGGRLALLLPLLRHLPPPAAPDRPGREPPPPAPRRPHPPPPAPRSPPPRPPRYGVPEPQPAPRLAADQGGLGLVQLE